MKNIFICLLFLCSCGQSSQEEKPIPIDAVTVIEYLEQNYEPIILSDDNFIYGRYIVVDNLEFHVTSLGYIFVMAGNYQIYPNNELGEGPWLNDLDSVVYKAHEYKQQQITRDSLKLEQYKLNYK